MALALVCLLVCDAIDLDFIFFGTDGYAGRGRNVEVVSGNGKCVVPELIAIIIHIAVAGGVELLHKSKGVVTGADVITDDQVEVINKDLIIATMTDDVPLNMELTIENGRGYVRYYIRYRVCSLL